DSAGQRARTEQHFTVGADNDGKLVALRHATTTHSSPVSEYTEPCGNMSRMLYSCSNVDVTHRLVKLNLTSPCPMRAPGECTGGEDPLRAGGFCISGGAEQWWFMVDRKCWPGGNRGVWRAEKESAGSIWPLA